MSHEKHTQPPCQFSLLHPAEQQATREAHLLTLEQALAALLAVTERFRGYELRTLEDCEKAETALAFADKALRDHDLLIASGYPCEEAGHISTLAYTLACIDEARMYLSAYHPHCQSRDMAHLRLRKYVSFRLERATKETHAVLEAARAEGSQLPLPDKEDRP